MHILYNKPRSNSTIQASGKDRNFRGSITPDWKTIKIANTVDITTIFNHFDIKIGGLQNKICCPIPSHKDATPSFKYYPDTKSYFCFGCKSGGGPVELVAAILSCDKIDAAKHILSHFDSSVSFKDSIDDEYAYAERNKILLKFSDAIRDYIYNSDNIQEAIKFAEKFTFVFDEINERNHINNDGLRSLIEKLIIRLRNGK